MCATVVFDLTVAIVIGVMVSIILFVLNNSHLHIEVRDIDKDRVGKDLKHQSSKNKNYVFKWTYFLRNTRTNDTSSR